MATRSVGPRSRARSLVSVTLPLAFVLLLVCYHSYKDAPVPLQKFEECQQVYCDRLADFFNTPIEWRVVLDVSESYVKPNKESNSYLLASQKISSLIETLPVAKGDSLCLDSFGVTYHRGRCDFPINAEWIRRVSARSDYFTRQIEALALDNSDKTKATDFRRSLTEIHQRDLSPGDGIRCGIDSRRRYYLFLTDGRHDPENLEKFQPLFPENVKDPSFARAAARFILPQLTSSRACPNLAQLVRGLYFVIDKSAATPEARDDWERGAEIFRSLQNTTSNSETRPFLPNITLWQPSSGILALGVDLRAEVDRNEGVFPCFPTGSVARTPHKYPYPKPYLLTSSCDRLFDNDFKVSLPSSVLSRGDGDVYVPYYTLQHGQNTEHLRLMLKSEDPLAPDEALTRRKQTLAERQLDWVSQRIDFEFQFLGSALETQRLPVKVSYGFGRKESQPPIFELYFSRPNVQSVIDYISSEPGRLPIILATVFLIGCVLSFKRAENAEKRFTVAQLVPASDEKNKNPERIIIHHRFDRNGIRLFLDRHEELIAAVRLRPEGVPNGGDFCIYDQDCATLLDIIPFASVIYYAFWCREADQPCGGRPLTTHRDVNASMYPPAANWIPDSDGRTSASRSSKSASLSWWKRWKNLYLPLKVRWHPSLPAERKLRHGGRKKQVFELWLTYRDRRGRLSLAFFQAAAFAAVLVATLQLWIPMLYEFIHELGATGGFSLCVLMLLPCFALVVGCRSFYLWRVTERNSLTFPRFQKLYAGIFWWLFWSAWFLVFFSSWGTATRLAVFVLVGLAMATVFLSEIWWVGRRMKNGSSFRVMDQIMDSAHRLLPFAS